MLFLVELSPDLGKKSSVIYLYRRNQMLQVNVDSKVHHWFKIVKQM